MQENRFVSFYQFRISKKKKTIELTFMFQDKNHRKFRLNCHSRVLFWGFM